MALPRRPANCLRLPALAAVFAAVMAFAAPAQAGTGELLRDACGRDGKVNGTYSQEDYRKALAAVPADSAQYSRCRAILQAARIEAASGFDQITPAAAAELLKGAGPKERSAIDEVVGDSTGAPVLVGDKVVEPASLGAGRKVTSGLGDLPTPLLIALALVAAGALAALAIAIPTGRRDGDDPER